MHFSPLLDDIISFTKCNIFVGCFCFLDQALYVGTPSRRTSQLKEESWPIFMQITDHGTGY